MKQKRPLLLLELLIALGLASILLTVVFQFLISNSKFNGKIESAQKALWEQQRLQERLSALFTSAHPTTGDSSFFTAEFPNDESLSIISKFDAGIDPDPAFSGPNLGRIYLDSSHTLRFTQWPLEKEGHRTEVLLNDVRSLEWEFLGHKFDKDPQSIPIAGTWAWLKHWPKTAPGVPSIIRLRIWRGIDKKNQREPNLRIAFILPGQEPIRMNKDL